MPAHRVALEIDHLTPEGAQGQESERVDTPPGEILENCRAAIAGLTLSNILCPEAPPGLETRTSKRDGIPLPRGSMIVTEWVVPGEDLPAWLQRVTSDQGGESGDDVAITLMVSQEGACWVHARHSFCDGDSAFTAEALWKHILFTDAG